MKKKRIIEEAEARDAVNAAYTKQLLGEIKALLQARETYRSANSALREQRDGYIRELAGLRQQLRELANQSALEPEPVMIDPVKPDPIFDQLWARIDAAFAKVEADAVRGNTDIGVAQNPLNWGLRLGWAVAMRLQANHVGVAYQNGEFKTFRGIPVVEILPHNPHGVTLVHRTPASGLTRTFRWTLDPSLP